MREESVNLSNIKLGIYEFLGLVIPGMVLLCEGWIFVRGWPRFTRGVSGLNAVSFTLLLITSFLLGHFVQELADTCLKTLRGERFFKKGRDDVWASAEAEPVKSAIWAESGLTLGDVDAAFDYCLTRSGDAFSRRDVFLATSDLSRSFLVLAVFGVAPACRLAFDRTHSIHAFILLIACYLGLLGLAGRLAWIRMVRFRRFSESGVFRSYLGSRPARNVESGERARNE
jgi:hypothetical protein